MSTPIPSREATIKSREQLPIPYAATPPFQASHVLSTCHVAAFVLTPLYLCTLFFYIA